MSTDPAKPHQSSSAVAMVTDEDIAEAEYDSLDMDAFFQKPIQTSSSRTLHDTQSSPIATSTSTFSKSVADDKYGTFIIDDGTPVAGFDTDFLYDDGPLPLLRITPDTSSKWVHNRLRLLDGFGVHIDFNVDSISCPITNTIRWFDKDEPHSLRFWISTFFRPRNSVEYRLYYASLHVTDRRITNPVTEETYIFPKPVESPYRCDKQRDVFITVGEWIARIGHFLHNWVRLAIRHCAVDAAQFFTIRSVHIPSFVRTPKGVGVFAPWVLDFNATTSCIHDDRWWHTYLQAMQFPVQRTNTNFQYEPTLCSPGYSENEYCTNKSTLDLVKHEYICARAYGTFVPHSFRLSYPQWCVILYESIAVGHTWTTAQIVERRSFDEVVSTLRTKECRIPYSTLMSSQSRIIHVGSRDPSQWISQPMHRERFSDERKHATDRRIGYPCDSKTKCVGPSTISPSPSPSPPPSVLTDTSNLWPIVPGCKSTWYIARMSMGSRGTHYLMSDVWGHRAYPSTTSCVNTVDKVESKLDMGEQLVLEELRQARSSHTIFKRSDKSSVFTWVVLKLDIPFGPRLIADFCRVGMLRDPASYGIVDNPGIGFHMPRHKDEYPSPSHPVWYLVTLDSNCDMGPLTVRFVSGPFRTWEDKKTREVMLPTLEQARFWWTHQPNVYEATRTHMLLMIQSIDVLVEHRRNHHVEIRKQHKADTHPSIPYPR